ncbi:hypothetical protein ABF162_14210 [Vibrio coralliilyticus]|uniref:hypothetical protein n=1 Tax=Vibrio coralliilyticus TaxID=190893 RepID=UPI00051292F1|nr:hypothetical protein [Vibrio coralliilyticus]AIU68027.1 hypothetical protein JV59_38045 [Vibrio coralliilyticus]
MNQIQFLIKVLIAIVFIFSKPLESSEFSYENANLTYLSNVAPYCYENTGEAFCVDNVFYIEDINVIFFNFYIDESFFRHLNYSSEDVLKETLNFFFLTLNHDAAKIKGVESSSFYIDAKYKNSKIVVGGKITRDQKTYVGYYRLDKLDNLITYKISKDYKDALTLFKSTADVIY